MNDDGLRCARCAHSQCIRIRALEARVKDLEAIAVKDSRRAEKAEAENFALFNLKESAEERLRRAEAELADAQRWAGFFRVRLGEEIGWANTLQLEAFHLAERAAERESGSGEGEGTGIRRLAPRSSSPSAEGRVSVAAAKPRRAHPPECDCGADPSRGGFSVHSNDCPLGEWLVREAGGPWGPSD